MITNKDKGGKKIVASGKIINEEIVKETKSITIKPNTLLKSIIVAKTPNVLETRAGEKENTISCVFKTIKTSKEDFKKKLLEQREGTSGLSVKLKTESDSDNKIKRLFKENQDEVTRLHESRVMSKGIEEEKERMTSWLQEEIIGNETSKEEYGKKVILQRHDNIESFIKLKTSFFLGNKVKLISKERQNEITRLNESRVCSETILELVNTTFQHKN